MTRTDLELNCLECGRDTRHCTDDDGIVRCDECGINWGSVDDLPPEQKRDSITDKLDREVDIIGIKLPAFAIPRDPYPPTGQTYKPNERVAPVALLSWLHQTMVFYIATRRRLSTVKIRA